MGYLHIDNLYKNQQILQFKTVYALEKIHGTSAHISWNSGELGFFSGGEKYERFVALFNKEALRAAFTEKFGLDAKVTVFGEAYGGKQQGMSATYGQDLRFVAFDVKVGDVWLQVEQADSLVQSLGLEFVEYERISATIEEIDRCRDKPSTQALRNCVADKTWDRAPLREGVVLRPPFEVTDNRGNRIIAKHKRDEFRETSTPQSVDPAKQVRLDSAEAIAAEWVTATRLDHVIDHLMAARGGEDVGMEDMRAIIAEMVADVVREGSIEASREVSKAIGTRTVILFKARLASMLEAYR